MPQRLPPLHWLHAFEAAARHMSFTDAAGELALTQSAVSQRIRLLEHHLGQQLFIRRPRGLELTEAAEAYLPTVRESFERIRAGTQEVFGPRRREQVTLRATPAFCALWLAPRLAAFRLQHPEITIRLLSAVWPGDFGAGGADLEVRYGRGDWPGMQADRLIWEQLLAVCSPDIARRLTAPADLEGETLIHTVGFDLGWQRWLNAVGARDVSMNAAAILCDTAIVALELAEHGAGVALARGSFAAQWLERGRLVSLFDRSVPTDEAFYLVAPDRRLAPTVETFRGWLREQIP